jgi:hypothetical protein
LSPITLHYDAQGHDLGGEPTVSNQIKQKLEAANVVVQAGRFRASGFVTKAPDGSEVVVTAAHVVAVDDTAQITITDSQNHTSRVTAGCYMYEDKGQRLDLPSVYTGASLPDAKEYDIAILRPEQPIGQPATVASAFPPRGSWLELVNDQRGADASKPAEYIGLVVSQQPSWLGDVALTGLQPQRASEGIASYSDQAGSSGGLAANPQTGQVEGLSYASGTHFSNAAQTEYFGVQFDTAIGPGTGIEPMETVLIGAQTIHLALASQRY